ncbi:MAG: nucleotide exchange factor GrpE [Gammaproteobacteria bacterium]|nr:nucleotide exchange factor GrpE [Gammaproteobacteria bacterium]
MNSPDSATPDDPTTAAPEADALKTEIETLRAQAAENLDKFLRAKAETENVRRRGETDVANAHKYAIERFALEMLAVKDSLERARAVELQARDAALEKMLEGVDLTVKLMESIFQKFSIVEVSPSPGDKFDPEKHQAMSAQPSADVPADHVLFALQKGYLLNNRLLRPALVIVAKAAEAAPSGNA